VTRDACVHERNHVVVASLALKIGEVNVLFHFSRIDCGMLKSEEIPHPSRFLILLTQIQFFFFFWGGGGFGFRVAGK
jgi:hypothetical protein